MINKVDYKKLVWLSALVAVLVVLFYSQVKNFEFGLNIDTLGLVGTIASVNWLLWGLFKKWLWKMRPFRDWLVMIPDLTGDWAGTMQSTWIDPRTNKGIAAIETAANIKQDLTTITIDFTTNEMGSQSILADVSCDPHRRVVEINYTYQSNPEATVKHRSPIHYGSAKLTYSKSKNSETLKGDYWTDRKTTGTITLKPKKPE